MVNIYMDKDGNTEEKIIVAYGREIEGNLNEKFTAFGYDRLPPDVQKAFGEKEDVVDKWVIHSQEAKALEKAFITYAYENSEGFSSWEEYRDAKLGKKEEITIESAQDVAYNDKPRETPAVEQDETPTFKVT